MRNPEGKSGDNGQENTIPRIERFKESAPARDSQAQIPILERKDAMFILLVQEKLNATAFMRELASKDEDIAMLRSLVAAAQNDAALANRRAAALQRENADLFRQLLVEKHKVSLANAGYVEGARLEELPDGTFALIKAPPEKGK